MKQILNEWRRFMSESKFERVGSCVVVDNKDRVLVLQRSKNDDWKAGWWDLPGGHLDEGEEPVDAAMRETKEESGLTVRNLKEVQIIPFDGGEKNVFVTRDWDGVVQLEENPETGEVEHDAFKWIQVDELEELENSIVLVSTIRRALQLV